jgi:hypothetical protein
MTPQRTAHSPRPALCLSQPPRQGFAVCAAFGGAHSRARNPRWLSYASCCHHEVQWDRFCSISAAMGAPRREGRARGAAAARRSVRCRAKAHLRAHHDHQHGLGRKRVRRWVPPASAQQVPPAPAESAFPPAAAMEAPSNEYEAARARRIAANKQQLAALGLANAAAQLGGPASGPIAGAFRPARRAHARSCRPCRRRLGPCLVAGHAAACAREALVAPNAERAGVFPAQAGSRPRETTWRRARRATTADRRRWCVICARRACSSLRGRRWAQERGALTLRCFRQSGVRGPAADAHLQAQARRGCGGHRRRGWRGPRPRGQGCQGGGGRRAPGAPRSHPLPGAARRPHRRGAIHAALHRVRCVC